MTRKFAFISDFDGTITKKDFYWHIIDKYMVEEGHALYKKWKRGELKDIEFLNLIFSNINKDKEQIYKDIIEIPMDSNVKSFIEFIKKSQGDFIIVSAGNLYYIDILLKYHGIENIKVYSNKGVYKNRGIHFELDPNYEFYSERYGINKGKIVKFLKKKYQKLYYAGDSEPDYEPSLLCNMRFATGSLVTLYEKNNISYIPFKNFNDIYQVLKDKIE
ncbi:MtnX-like HAD-IB family phosphatase [Defluviitalea phaphyphila]|uniref:MtnX-like HAD-IB family phosphatase n=1 Tax=Defluviitalea phaphyphila TaxID=1473580 RepID=UPI000730EEDA|nr:MtnX-like HAD-IB family phosphatase [Defluviitalea phaphyphila]